MSGRAAPIRLTTLVVSAAALAVTARGDAAPAGAVPVGASAMLPVAALTAGATTVLDASRDAFSYPARNLRDEHRAAFFVGNSFFNENWVAAPASVSTRDGLGPLFNVRSCSGCHFKDGRGRPPEDGEPLRSMLLRISVPGAGPHGAPRPHAVYGDQIQGLAIPGVPAEADVLVSYEPVGGTFADGTRWELRRPRYRLERLAYGPVGGHLLTSPRVAPAMIGLGLLEAVPEAALLARADADDRDGDGVSGRANVVWDERRRATAVGRFGWKAEQPTVLQQTAGAFAGDMGITSSLVPAENHTAGERACAGRPSGGAPEIEDGLLQKVALYARTLGVPARRGWQDPGVRRGETVFGRAGCAACHLPELVTGPVDDLPELGGQVIHAYTDLLLHDLGAELGDGRPTFAADGREWRTPPLWGLGLVPVVNGHALYLHDGRARGLGEAVLWHGGEAAAARAAFVRMSVDERRDLLSFVGSL